MSAYLDRLHQLERVKNSHYAPDSDLPKPTEPPFVSFGGTWAGYIVKNIIEGTDTGAFAHWRWRVVFADGNVKIAAFTPPAAWDEVKEVYPDAVSGQKINEVKCQPGDTSDF